MQVWRDSAAVALALLGRPFPGEQVVVVKPSNIVNIVGEDLLALSPESRAVAIYAPLRQFLASVLKKGLDGRLWVRKYIDGLIDDGSQLLGFTPRDLLGQTDIQIAGLGWLLQWQMFEGMRAKFPNRVSTANMGRLLIEPGEMYEEVASALNIARPSGGASDEFLSRAIQNNSKTGIPFDARSQLESYKQSLSQNHDEVEKVVAWIEHVARLNSVELPQTDTTIST